MSRKITWIIMSCAVAVAMILASCGKTPATTTPTTTPTSSITTTTTTTTTTTAPTTTPTTVRPTYAGVPAQDSAPLNHFTPPKPGAELMKVTFTKLDGSKVEKWVEKPIYGGTITVMERGDVSGWDPMTTSLNRRTVSYVSEQLVIGDIARGPGGTGEWPFNSQYQPLEMLKGWLAERWEISPDGKTYTFHLRKGIYWQNVPPVNGRELVATDIKYSWDRRLGTGSGFTKPSSTVQTGSDVITNITTPDKYTVVFNTSRFDYATLTAFGYYAADIYPPEVITTYGAIKDWRHLIGTGPYILTDYVPDSSLTLKKNLNYWGEDELRPGYKLPYADTIKSLIVPDISTQIAALRSGKADAQLYDMFDWRTTEDLLKTNPDLQASGWVVGTASGFVMQIDTPPFNDLRVRQALQMSLDLQAIAEAVGGRAGRYPSVLSEPYGPDLYTPFDQLPKAAKDVLTYNPGKANQLLAEAGYPKGFEFELATSATSLSAKYWPLAADYFSRIGVTMNIAIKDSATLSSLSANRSYKNAYDAVSGTASVVTYFRIMVGPFKLFRSVDAYKAGDDLYEKMRGTVDTQQRYKLMKELNYYTIENVLYLGIVAYGPKYQVMQPWIRGWSGEINMTIHNPGSVITHLWVDPSYKK